MTWLTKQLILGGVVLELMSLMPVEIFLLIVDLDIRLCGICTASLFLLLEF